MDKFEKVKTLEAAEFWVGKQPPADWGVTLTTLGRDGDMAVKFIDGSVEVFTKAESLEHKIEFKLRPKRDDA